MRIAITLGFALAAVAPTLQAQTPAAAPVAAVGNTTPGAVTRVTLLRIKTGQNNAFWEDIRRNGKAIFDEEKRRGIITNYGYFTKSTSDGPADWDVGVSVTYANWAAFDGLGDRIGPVTLAHYGSAEARTAAATARTNNAEVMQSFLIRAQTPNPIAK